MYVLIYVWFVDLYLTETLTRTGSGDLTLGIFHDHFLILINCDTKYIFCKFWGFRILIWIIFRSFAYFIKCHKVFFQKLHFDQSIGSFVHWLIYSFIRPYPFIHSFINLFFLMHALIQSFILSWIFNTECVSFNPERW